MFTDLHRDHKLKHDSIQKERVAAAAELEQASRGFSEALVSSLNCGVAETFANQKTVERKVRELNAQTKAYKQQTSKWAALVRSVDEILREVGDFENALNMVENDCEHIAETFELIAKSQDTAAEAAAPPSQAAAAVPSSRE